MWPLGLAFLNLHLLIILGICIHGLFKYVKEKRYMDGFIPVLVLSIIIVSTLYNAVEVYFCEKKKVEVLCCVDYDDFYCIESDLCEREICID